jgi:hypothetical protein
MLTLYAAYILYNQYVLLPPYLVYYLSFSMSARRAVVSTHCTMCGKDLPLITPSDPRTVRESTTLGTSFFRWQYVGLVVCTSKRRTARQWLDRLILLVYKYL